MKSVARRPGRWKKKVSERREEVKAMQKMAEIDDLDVKISLIQELIPIGLKRVNELLQDEVRQLAGPKGKHNKVNTRWGGQWGSVYLGGQKIPVRIPRVRNKSLDEEVPLENYPKLQQPHHSDEQTFKKLLNGISTHKYQESAELVPEVFGLSASNMSKRFKYATAARLKKLQTRRLNQYDFVAIFIDGKRFADEGIVISVGITIKGKKVILGIEQMSTENHRAIGQFFDKLIERGLDFQKGLLFIVDGSKGIIKAINQKFKGFSLIQRCQWHKREDVVNYLSKSQQALWRRKLQKAYAKTTYTEAKTALTKLGNELREINSSAAGSGREGMEETLTIYKLKLSTELRKSFSTTNCISACAKASADRPACAKASADRPACAKASADRPACAKASADRPACAKASADRESIMSQVERYTRRVSRWRNGEHIKRWEACGLLEVEPRLRKVYPVREFSLMG